MHPMTKWFKESPEQFVCAIIWKMRQHLPALKIDITVEDLGAYTAALKRHNLEPGLFIKGQDRSFTLGLVDTEIAAILIAEEEANPGAAEGMKELMALRSEARTLAQRMINNSPVMDANDVARACVLLAELSRDK